MSTVGHRSLPPSRHELRVVPRRRSLLAAGAALPLASTLAACGGEGDGPGEVGPPDLQAELPRADSGPAEGAGAATIPFTARLLGTIERAEVNAVCSPLSAQIALTMAGMGAAGATRSQMEDVLGGSMDELAEVANTLADALAAVGEEQRAEPAEDQPDPPIASLVNGVWAQEGMTIQEQFLEDLAAWFGSGVYEVDFRDADNREDARQRINSWVEEATNDLIEELVPEDMLSEDSRMVLVNALHLKASWHSPLTTGNGPFTTADGEELEVETLSGGTRTWYEDELCRATALGTYGNDLALALIQPVEDVPAVLDAWAEAADDPSAGLGAVLEGLAAADEIVDLTLPAFDIGWEDSLSALLVDLGMTEAFSGDADFSGITTDEALFISEVIQKAVITVDEEGMEAAAATAVGMDAASAPAEPKELVLDAPFLFVAYEASTLAPLVLGWIGDPAQTR